MNKIRIVSAIPLILALAACNEAPAEEAAPAVAEAPATEEAPAHDHAHHAEGDAPALPAVPEGARVFFVSPADGARIAGVPVDGKVKVAVVMGAENVRVGPAGEVEEGAGHHHIIVDATATPVGAAVPADDTHIHFGGGQTETELMLSPGEHTLTLQLADGIHRSYGPALSSSITITVATE